MPAPQVWQSQTQINTGTIDGSTVGNAQVVALTNGNFAVVWEDTGNGTDSDLHGRIYNAEGVAITDTLQLHPDTSTQQIEFDVAATNDGGFGVVYVNVLSNDTTAVGYRRYDTTGTSIYGVELGRESTSASTLRNPEIAIDLLDNSGLVTFLEDTADPNAHDIPHYRTLTDAEWDSGATVGDDGRFNTLGADILRLDGGNYVHVYSELDLAGNASVSFVLVDASGNVIGDTFDVGDGSEPQVTAMAGGGFAIIYDGGFAFGSHRMLVHRFDAAGVQQGNAIVLTSTGGLDYPEVVGLQDGSFVFVYSNQSSTGQIRADHVDSNGSFLGSFLVGTAATAGTPSITLTGDGRLIFAWTDGTGVYTEIRDPRGPTIDADDYTATTQNFIGTDVITTGQFNTTILMNGDVQEVRGQGGDDTLVFHRLSDVAAGALYDGGDNDSAGNTLAFTRSSGTFDLSSVGLIDFQNLRFDGDGAGQTLRVIMAAARIHFDGLSSTGTIDMGGTSHNEFQIRMYHLSSLNLQNLNIENYDIGEDSIRILGDADAELITGTEVADEIIGAGGNDRLIGGLGQDTLNGGLGNDTIDGGDNADVMIGGGGRDLFYVNSIGDSVREIGNNFDAILASVSIDLTSANFIGRIEAVNLQGTNNLTVIGSGIDNLLTGNSGDNVLNGRAGADEMRGRGGNDTYYIDNVGDVVDETLPGSGGLDRIFATVSVNMHSGVEVLGDVERLFLIGTGHIDGLGNNLDNVIVGNDGNNQLNGWSGQDRLTGGLGNDVFWFSQFGSAEADTITDFDGASDQIWLVREVFDAFAGTGPIAAGNLYFAGTGPRDADDYLIYNQANGAILYDRDGVGGDQAEIFAWLTPGTALTAGDFLLI